MTSGMLRPENPVLDRYGYLYWSLMPESWQSYSGDYHENLRDFMVSCDYLEAKIEIMQGMRKENVSDVRSDNCGDKRPV